MNIDKNEINEIANGLNIQVKSIYIGLFFLSLYAVNDIAKTVNIESITNNFSPSDILINIGILALLVYSVVLHEVAHGYMAYRLGDPTSKFKKRLSLNPFDHIRPIMLILILVFVILGIQSVFLGVIFALTFARPVPVNLVNLPTRKSQGLVALAGPVTNITIAVIISLLLVLILEFLPFSSNSAKIIVKVLYQAMVINFALAFLNLIPMLPLDGGRILASHLSDRHYYSFMRMEKFGIIIIVLFILLGATEYIFLFAQYFSNLLLTIWGILL